VTVTKAPASQINLVDPDSPSDCQVELVLPNKRRLIVSVGVEPEALARILAVVDGQ
jgi:transposase